MFDPGGSQSVNPINASFSSTAVYISPATRAIGLMLARAMPSINSGLPVVRACVAGAELRGDVRWDLSFYVCLWYDL